MGHSLATIPDIPGNIRIRPHSASSAAHLNRAVSIREFADGHPVTVSRRDDNGHLVAERGRYPDIAFIEGPEVPQ